MILDSKQLRVSIQNVLDANATSTSEATRESGSLKFDLQLFAKNKFPTGSVSGKDVVTFLKKEDFLELSQNGSYVKLKGPTGEVVIVPVHRNKDLPTVTLKSNQKQAGCK